MLGRTASARPGPLASALVPSLAARRRQREAELRAWHAGHPEAQDVAELRARQRAVAVGVVAKLRLIPSSGLDMVLDDGSGRLLVRFSGPLRLTGVLPGAALRVEGMVAQEAGGPVMRNPEWTTVAAPA